MNEIVIKNVAFFDAEFTALTAEDRGIQEMIQCALIIYQMKFSSKNNAVVTIANDPLVAYTTFVRPIYNPTLSDYIRQLTNIRQEDVDHGQDFCSALDHIFSICTKHRVDSIITWGPDRTLLRHNCDIVDYNKRKSKILLNKVQDVSKIVSDRLGYDGVISQHKACQLLNIAEDGIMHNAYYDAINLARIIKEFCRQNAL